VGWLIRSGTRTCPGNREDPGHKSGGGRDRSTRGGGPRGLTAAPVRDGWNRPVSWGLRLGQDVDDGPSSGDATRTVRGARGAIFGAPEAKPVYVYQPRARFWRPEWGNSTPPLLFPPSSGPQGSPLVANAPRDDGDACTPSESPYPRAVSQGGGTIAKDVVFEPGFRNSRFVTPDSGGSTAKDRRGGVFPWAYDPAGPTGEIRPGLGGGVDDASRPGRSASAPRPSPPPTGRSQWGRYGAWPTAPLNVTSTEKKREIRDPMSHLRWGEKKQ